MTIPLQTGIVYGPMNSRRFGKSLGVNLLPDARKICSFDCLYCQYSAAETHHSSDFPSLEQIKEEAGAFFSTAKSGDISYDWITIAGNGEPTLHPHFEEAVKILAGLRDQYLYAVPIGILSNASTCHKPEIRRSLLMLDGRFMKLDAGRQQTFEALNQPASRDAWTCMIRGLNEIKPIVLQSMFVAGRVDNTSAEEIDEWIKIIQRIQPEGVQIYTLDRSPQHPDVLPAAKETLENIARCLTDKTRIASFVYGPN